MQFIMEPTPDFKGKTVSFSTAESTLAIVEPTFETQGGRLFVVGTIPAKASTNDWAEGRLSAVAWDAVTDYIVFDSVDQYVELLKLSEVEEED